MTFKNVPAKRCCAMARGAHFSVGMRKAHTEMACIDIGVNYANFLSLCTFPQVHAGNLHTFQKIEAFDESHV